MPSVVKYLMSTITDTGARNDFKRNMVQAVLQSHIKPAKEEKQSGKK